MKVYLGLVLAALAALFVWLGIAGGGGNAFDVETIGRLAAWRQAHPQVTSAVIGLTQLGSAEVTLSVPLLMAALLWVKARKNAAALLAATVVLERLTADSLKLLYDRARPAVDLHPVITSSSSYPSGHAANSTTAFVALALFAAPAHLRRPALAAAIMAGIAIGLTRPYLGVHWPSDVMGGWTLAAMVLIIAWTIGRRHLAADEAKHQVVGGHRPPLDQG